MGNKHKSFYIYRRDSDMNVIINIARHDNSVTEL